MAVGTLVMVVAIGGAQVPAVLVAVAVVVAGAQVPVTLVEAAVLVAGAQVPVSLVVVAAGVMPVPLEVVLVLLHGEFPQIQMVPIHLDGGDLLPQDGKVQLKKLIVDGMFNYAFHHIT